MRFVFKSYKVDLFALYFNKCIKNLNKKTSIPTKQGFPLVFKDKPLPYLCIYKNSMPLKNLTHINVLLHLLIPNRTWLLKKNIVFLAILFFSLCCIKSYSQVIIDTQPTAQTVCVGATATFSVAASGTVSGYQWYKDGSLITGANTSTYITPITTAADNNAQYEVEVLCSCGGNVMSNTVALTVNSPAQITVGPFLTQTKCEGENITLSVTAVGTITGYQWKKGAANIVGQTGASLTLTNLSAADASNYSVDVFAVCGNDSYGPIALSVNQKPTISLQPVGATKCVGQNYTFSVTAANAGSFEWYKDGVLVSNGAAGGGSSISGATTSSMTISNLCATCNPGSYTVKVFGSGACVSQNVTSNAAVLIINETADITTGPFLTQNKCEGDNLSLSVTATGTPTPSFQWQKGGVNVGTNSNTFSISNLAITDAGSYSVTATNSCGSDTYGTINVTVNPKPTISTQPVGATKCVNQSYTFSVVAANAGSYQWYKNGAIIAGAINSSFTISSIQASDVGNYKVVVTGTGACNSQTITSTEVGLNVNDLVTITSQPVPQTLCEGATANFTVTAWGTITGYQWYKNGAAIAGANDKNYSLATTIANNNDRYKVEISGPCGNITSTEAVLIVNTKPIITLQPTSAIKCEKESIAFDVNATNAGTFQWQLNGNNKAGATSSTVIINNLTLSDAGVYRAFVKGEGACSFVQLVSNEVVLKVNELVKITSQPVSQTICETGGVNFSVAAIGTITGYKWYKNGAEILNATNNNYSFATTIANNNDRYKVEISGPCGNVTSAEVVLTITHIDPPTISTNKPNGMCTGEQTLLTATGCAGTVNWYRNGVAVFDGASYTTNVAAEYTAKCTHLGCTSLTFSNSLKVVQLSELTYTTKIINVTCFDGKDGDIELTPTGSAGEPYTIDWKIQNSKNFKISNLIAGDYPVTITDKIGCKVDRTVTVRQPIKTRINISTIDITCFGKGDGKISFGGGVSDYGGFQYVINNGIPTAFSNSNSHIITALNKGTYTVSVADAKKCEVLAPTQVTINEPDAVVVSLVAAKDPKSFESKDGSIQIRVVGGLTPYSYQWFDGAGTQLSANIFNSATGSVIAPIDGGTYKVVAKDKNGCEQPFNYTLTTPKRIEIANKIDSISCFGKNDGKATITITGGITTNTQLPYKTIWNKINADGTKTQINSDVLTIASLLPGTYEITATDANNISRTTLFTLINPAELKTNISRIVGNHCASTPLGEAYFDIIGGRKPYKVTWNNTTVVGTSITALSAGNQALVVSDASGCLNNVTAVIPDETQSFKVALKYELPTCFGKCDAKLASTVNGGFTPYKYSWSGINASLPNLTDVCGKGETVLTITDNKGCVLKSATVALTSPAPKVLGIAKEKEVCPSKPFELNGTAASWGKTFIWTFPNGQTKNGAIIQADSIGIYKITVLDENSCGGQDEIAVVANKNVKQLFTVANEAVVSKPVVAIDLTQPTPTDIKWEYVGGTLVSQNAYQVKVSFAKTGIYKIKELVTVDNCVYTLIKSIEIKAAVDNKGFPEPFGFTNFDANILGNPVNGGRIGIEIQNDENEPITVVLDPIDGTNQILKKEFLNNASLPIYIDVPLHLQEGAYILNIYTPSNRISKKIFLIR